MVRTQKMTYNRDKLFFAHNLLEKMYGVNWLVSRINRVIIQITGARDFDKLIGRIFL